jgi:hypothetical protein
MLNKKTSDILMIMLIIIVTGILFFIRFILIDQMDSRIENTERNNIQLQTQISNIEGLVEENRNEQLPSLIEMYQNVPLNFNREQLSLYIQAQLELSSISQTNLVQFNIGSAPTVFPQGSALRTLSEEVDIYTIVVSFRTDDLENVHTFLDHIVDSEQYFIIQSIEYDLSVSETEIPVTIALAAPYVKTSE